MHIKPLITGLLALSLLAGCASNSTSIKPADVSTNQYADRSCRGLTSDYRKTWRNVKKFSKKQDAAADGDAAAVGVGAIFFLPALFFISSEDYRKEVAQFKGEVIAVEAVAAQKGCSDLLTKIKTDQEKAAAEAAAEKARRAAKNNNSNDDK